MKRKAFFRTAVILGILLCMTAAIGAVSVRADCQGAGTVTASALNMRSEASTTSSVVTCLPKGTVVLVTGTQDGWYKVWYQGQSGYMSDDYISFASTAQANFGTGTIQGTGVRVRSGPSTGDAIVATVNTGTTMSVTGVSGSWYQVSYNGSTAYVNGSYLNLSASGSQSAAPQANAGASSGSGASGSTGTINGDYVRLRSGPSTGYSVLGSYNKGATMTVTGSSGDWYAVTAGSLKGYVYKQYLTVQSAGTSGGTGTSSSGGVTAMNETGTTTTAVHMRSGPSTSYASQRVLAAGTRLTVTGQTNGWYQVSYNGATGYVCDDYVSCGKEEAPDPSGTSSNSTSYSTAGERIVAEARKYQGVPYVYGGTSPSGFDCSGFVYYVYKQCGYSITRTATAQSYLGANIARVNLRPGDIIIFYNGYKSAIGHSGIYIGNNQFIHASSGSGKVIVSSLSETYYNTRFYSARRVAN